MRFAASCKALSHAKPSTKALSRQTIACGAFCFEVGLSLSASDLNVVMQRAFENKDPLVRKAAVLQLGGALPDNQLKKFLARARNDAWMPVRREALRIYAQKYQDEAEKEFKSALLDCNVAVREEAQYYFRKMRNLPLRS